jgi:hypothetical protein
MAKPSDVYRLEVRVQIRRMERMNSAGYDQFTNEQLSVEQTVELGAMNFLQVAGVLGQFQTLADEIKAAHGQS